MTAAPYDDGASRLHLEHCGKQELAGDGSLISYIKNNIRTAVFNESSTKSGNVNALRDLGISIDRSGKMTFDATAWLLDWVPKTR